MIRAGRTPRAFTLLEVLVALAMTASLAGALYATLYVSFRAQASAVRAVDEPRRAEITLERVAADLRSAVIPNDILAGTFLGEDDLDGTGRENDSLLLCIQAPAGAARVGTSDIRMIELSCDDDLEDDLPGRVLLRRVTDNLLAPTTQEPQEQVLCRGVRSFSLRYFDGTDWLDGWDSTTEDNTLPLAVEVTLELEPPEDDRELRRPDDNGYLATRVIRIPCSSLTAGTITSGG